MAKQWKVVILWSNDTGLNTNQNNTAEINSLLSDGWRIRKIVPMGAADVPHSRAVVSLYRKIPD